MARIKPAVIKKKWRKSKTLIENAKACGISISGAYSYADREGLEYKKFTEKGDSASGCGFSIVKHGKRGIHVVLPKILLSDAPTFSLKSKLCFDRRQVNNGRGKLVTELILRPQSECRRCNPV